MKIGLITKEEKYWGTRDFSKNTIDLLKKEFKASHLRLTDKTNTSKIQDLYKKSDIVINLSTKSINYNRRFLKPTIFFAYAWMDHGAGINLYCNRRFFLPNDILVFASKPAQKKYKYIYRNGLKSFVIPFYTGVEKVKLSSKETSKLKNKYQIPENKKILVYFGRLSSEKNIDLILHFTKKLGGDFLLLLIGKTNEFFTYGFPAVDEKQYHKNLNAQVKKNKLANTIIIEKIDRDDLIKILSISFLSINLTTCYEENFGISTIESMAIGLPVIGTDWGGLKDTLRSGTGLALKTKIKDNFHITVDSMGAVEFVDNLSVNQALYKQMIKKCQSRANRYYSEKAFLQNLIKIINQVHMKEMKSSRTELLLPRTWVRKIYDFSLRKNQVHRIYEKNPALFKKLYKFYASEL